MKKVWNKERDNYLKEIYEGRTNREIAKLMSSKFNYKFTENSIDSRKVILGIRSGKCCSNIFTRDIVEYVKNNHKGKSTIELSEEVNKKFNLHTNSDSIQNLKSRIKKSEGFEFEPARNDGCFIKGQKSWNKGKKWDEFMSKESQEKSRITCFKKGNDPANMDAIGTEKWKSGHKDRNDEGFLYVKVQDKHGRFNWKAKHRLIWEQAYGKIPKGYKVIFKDGNRHNITLENLALVSNSQMLILNSHKLIFEEQELTEVGINIAKVLDKVNEKSRL